MVVLASDSEGFRIVYMVKDIDGLTGACKWMLCGLGMLEGLGSS